MNGSAQNRYRSVLRSSSLIGGAAFVNIAIGMIRTKFAAVLLDPSGVGLINMYSAIIAPIVTTSNLGLNTSGIRAIAEASGRNETERVARVVKTLQKTVWFSGILGCLITMFFSYWLSFFTFQNADHTIYISALGITVLFTNLTMGQSCVLQGTRRILDVAKINIWGAISGTFASIPCYFWWGGEGIVPSIIISSFFAFFTSWWFARKVEIADVELSNALLFSEAKKMLNFGLPLMGTSLQAALVAYFLRLIISSQFGLDGVGVWSAAFAISGVLVNFVLNAMGTDYYPRLTAVAHDNALVSKEVNAQLEVALLMATPALLITILFAPIGVELLYSGKFDAAIPVLRWSVYGILGRVISWPFSFIIIAQGRGKFFFVAELLAHIVHFFLIYICSKFWGLPGTGIGFMILYIYYFIFMTVTAHFIARTHPTFSNLKLITFVLLLLIGVGFLPLNISNPIVYYVISGLISIIVTALALVRLFQLTGVSINDLRARLRY